MVRWTLNVRSPQEILKSAYLSEPMREATALTIRFWEDSDMLTI